MPSTSLTVEGVQEVGRDLAVPQDDAVGGIDDEPLALQVHEVHEHEVVRQVARRIALAALAARRGRRAPSRSDGGRRRSRSPLGHRLLDGGDRRRVGHRPEAVDGPVGVGRLHGRRAGDVRGERRARACRRDRRRGRTPARGWCAPPASARAGPRGWPSVRLLVAAGSGPRRMRPGARPRGSPTGSPSSPSGRDVRLRVPPDRRLRVAQERAFATPFVEEPRGLAGRVGQDQAARSSASSRRCTRRDRPARSRRTAGRRPRRARPNSGS